MSLIFPITPFSESEFSSCRLYIGTTHACADLGGRWCLILRHSDEETYSLFYTVGSPYKENPYKRQLDENQRLKHPKRIFEAWYEIGVIQEEDLDKLMRVFINTEAGPDQFFTLRFLEGLASEGLVEYLLVKKLLSEPKYSDSEADHYEYKLAPVDAEFFARKGFKRELDLGK
ncbi:hypothetical protein BDW59DRAFT_157964 [Aspergillus cavernicola]|uniref:Uncharacterized protein n=1 Tax=Aspergillus cavernicola TaxID=176166 RepID=A0ABR4IXE6_9EURO